MLYSFPVRNKYSNQKEDFREHGTHILGIISRIAPKATIIPVDIEVAMSSFKSLHDYAKQNNITVVSMSIRLEETPDLCSNLIQGFTVNHIPFFKATNNEAIDYSKTEECKTIIERARTHNDLNTHLFFLGFTEYSNNLFSFLLKENMSKISAYTSEKINYILAPGTKITSTLPANKFGKMTGSSMATPIAAASYALLNNYYKNQLNEDHYIESKIILEALFNSCRNIQSSEHRVVDLNKSIEYANRDLDNIANS
ncbi:MAG: S8 family serine peptidase [Parachlamydiaceae bacterium]|nr:S8 family serine peptidase [Parachlamydiaceae bacterium]